MKRVYRVVLFVLGMILASSGAVFAQDSSSGGTNQTAQGSSASPFKAGLGINIGAQTFNEPNLSGTGTIPVTWQSLALQPDLSFGKIGIGLDVMLHYRFTGGFDIYGQSTSQNFQVRTEDWVPSPFTFSNLLSLYLPKIAYVRYGQKGDPLYAKLGSIDDSTLGNGFIVGGYSNTLFLPEQRIFGLNFDMDGSLFKFPYVGVQTFVGNLSRFDVFGAALYGRPLLGLNVPIVKNLQLSGIIAADRNPYLWTDPSQVPANAATASVAVYGADVTVPILSNPVVSLASMGSIAFENTNTGGMVGVAGRLIKFITYGAQLRFLGNNFIPDYFGPTYDLYRAEQLDVVNGTTPVAGSVAWFATAGFSLLSDKLVFNVNLDGPFRKAPSGSTNFADYPHLRAVFQLAEGVIPNLYFGATYDKKMISSFKELVSADNAVIGASINYKTGPAVITLTYDLRHSSVPNPQGDYWTVNSGLSSSISLF